MRIPRRTSRWTYAGLARAALMALTACGTGPGNESSPPPGDNRAKATADAQPPNTVSPLIGLWHQTSAPCARGTPAPRRVEELEFQAGGRFLISFGAFEVYRDYWGQYRHDPASGTLHMQVERGNVVPADLDLEGRATRAPNGELVLEGISFGTPPGSGPEARTCVLRFSRRR